MPKQGDTRTVKEMKAAIKKAQAKGSQAQPPEVVQLDRPQAQPAPVDNSVQAQPFDANLTTSEGCIEHKEHKKTTCKEVNLKEEADMLVLHNHEVEQLVSDGMSAQQIREALDTLLPLYAAEGITPSSHVLMVGIRQLQADAR